MLTLGQFSFSLDTATYQELKRSTEYRWKSQERINNPDAFQFTGTAPDSMTLSGVVFPVFRGGFGQVEAMRVEAAQGTPLMLTDGYGGVHGRWVITRIDEQQSTFLPGGAPRKQKFTLQLRSHDDGRKVHDPRR